MLGALSATVLTVAAAGCGSADGYDNAARPPAPSIVAVASTPGACSCRPTASAPVRSCC